MFKKLVLVTLATMLIASNAYADTRSQLIDLIAKQKAQVAEMEDAIDVEFVNLDGVETELLKAKEKFGSNKKWSIPVMVIGGGAVIFGGYKLIRSGSALSASSKTVFAVILGAGTIGVGAGGYTYYISSKDVDKILLRVDALRIKLSKMGEQLAIAEDELIEYEDKLAALAPEDEVLPTPPAPKKKL